MNFPLPKRLEKTVSPRQTEKGLQCLVKNVTLKGFTTHTTKITLKEMLTRLSM